MNYLVESEKLRNMKRLNMLFQAIVLLFMIVVFGCTSSRSFDQREKFEKTNHTEEYNESELILKSKEHENPRMHYKLIDSKVLPSAKIWSQIIDMLDGYAESDYKKDFKHIYEKDIAYMQSKVQDGTISYERISKWYLYRIKKYEQNLNTTLHGIISIMPDVIALAQRADKNKSKTDHPIFGMPILLKDNINAEGRPTTAGAEVLMNNEAPDAYIVERLKSKGAIILGKVNLSEWAYYFCDGCPLGYSAVGGQSLNPYGRMIFETGGSSAGSGTTMAANYAAAAIGTETAGSILSPSSQNSLYGLKPTIGVLSRSGIVPISGTLDTPGPMTRSIEDNAILFDAMLGYDKGDSKSQDVQIGNVLTGLGSLSSEHVKFGYMSSFMEDSLYAKTIEHLSSKGIQLVEINYESASFDGFLDVLNYDMQRDLPEYLNKYGESAGVSSVSDVIEYNLKDSTVRAPYGQGRFIASRDDNTDEVVMEEIKMRLEREMRASFDVHFDAHQLDGILSINNYSAASAAMAKYPCLATPMGYTKEGEPKSLTIIGKPFEEKKLLQMGKLLNKAHNVRKAPINYQ